MAAVWYIGNADARTITAAQWTAAGITGSPTTSTWDKSNGWSIPAASFTAPQLALLAASPDFNTIAADGARAGQAIVAEAQDQSPKELAYASITSTVTNTVASLNVGDTNSKVTGLAFTLVGTGRPVNLRAYMPKMSRTVASTLRLALIQDGAAILNCNDTQVAANSGIGMIVEARTAPLTKGQTYSFDVRMCGDAAGTTTCTAAAGSHVPYLVADQR